MSSTVFVVFSSLVLITFPLTHINTTSKLFIVHINHHNNICMHERRKWGRIRWFIHSGKNNVSLMMCVWAEAKMGEWRLYVWEREKAEKQQHIRSVTKIGIRRAVTVSLCRCLHRCLLLLLHSLSLSLSPSVSRRLLWTHLHPHTPLLYLFTIFAAFQTLTFSVTLVTFDFTLHR